jgi:hypothetical protein
MGVLERIPLPRPRRQFRENAGCRPTEARTPASTMSEPHPHPANVAGDFYVEDGCCISCMVPHSVAPDLMAMAEPEGHCYVCKQPATPEELDRMFEAFEVQEVDCIRYKGTDRVIQIRLIEASSGDQCDELLADLVAANRAANIAAERRRRAWVESTNAKKAKSGAASPRSRFQVRNAVTWLSTWLKKKS